MVVGDTCVSEAGMVATVSRDKRFRICCGAHGFYDASKLDPATSPGHSLN